jgi:divalent metal cation (Fe/Co/Zn/Cd) transporter
VAEGHAIAKEVNKELLHHISYMSKAVIHIDPIEEAGEVYHKVD